MSAAQKKIYTAAVVGTGRIGFSLGFDKKREQPASHTMALNANPRIKIIAGVDTNPENLKRWKKVNPKAAAFTSLAQMYGSVSSGSEQGQEIVQDKNALAEENGLPDNKGLRRAPDIVVVAVNEDAHLSVTLEAISHKPRLLILEKPVALNLKEAAKIKSAAKKYNVPILVNHERRFAIDWNLAASYLQKIGDLQSIDARLFSGMRLYDPAAEGTGGYSLLHDGTHLVDITLFLLENAVSRGSEQKQATGNRSRQQWQATEAGNRSRQQWQATETGNRQQRQESVQDKNALAEESGLLDNKGLMRGGFAQLKNPVITGLHHDAKNKKIVRNLNAHYKTKICPSVTLTMSGRSRYFGFEVDIVGTEGRILIGNGFARFYRRQESKLYTGFYSLEEDDSVELPKKGARVQTGYFANMVQNAVDFLDGKAELKSTLQTGINALKVLEEIKSVIRGKE